MAFFTKRNIIIIIIIVLIAIGIIAYFVWKPKNNKSLLSKSDPKKIEEIDKNLLLPVDNSSNVFLEIECNGISKGKIEIELFDNDVPKTAKNFRHLCIQGVRGGISPYINTKFHRVIKDFMIQGGDIENKDGTGGYSIYGKFFKDENFKLEHNQQGLVVMANAGKDSNNSQFYILTKKKGANWLNGKFVVFGIVVSGYNIVKEIEYMPVDKKDCPITECKIIDCGIVDNNDKKDSKISSEKITLSI